MRLRQDLSDYPDIIFSPEEPMEIIQKNISSLMNSEKLISASEEGNLHLVKTIIRLNSNCTQSFISIEDINKAINYSVIHNRLPVLKFLTGLPGADPANKENWAFINAASKGYLEMVKFLVTLPGVNPAACNNRALRLAAGGGHLETVQFLLTLPGVIPNDFDNDAFRSAAGYGHLDILKFLIKLPSITPADFDNQAIKRASYSTHFPIVTFLISHARFSKQVIDDAVTNAPSRDFKLQIRNFVTDSMMKRFGFFFHPETVGLPKETTGEIINMAIKTTFS